MAGRPRAGLRAACMGRARTRSGSTAADAARAHASRSWAMTAGRWGGDHLRRRCGRGAGRAWWGGRAAARIDLRLSRAASWSACDLAGPELPFEFDCGFAGWLGYELKAECGGDAAHESPLPDAAFVFADRMIAFDHAERAPTCSASPSPAARHEADEWLAATAARLARAAAACERLCDGDAPASPVELRLARPRERYLEEIAECKRLLAEGETYEVCLTNAVVAECRARAAGALPRPAPGQPGAVRLLRALRRRRRAQLLAGALPARRPRPLGRGEADQGDEPPRRDRRRGRAPRRAPARRREEPGREPDDRRPAAQRPRLGLRGRHRARAPT